MHGQAAHNYGYRRYERGKYLDYQQNQVPPPWEEVERFCREWGIAPEVGRKWYSLSAYNNWRTKPKCGKSSPIRAWCHALRAFDDRNLNWSPAQDSMNNEQFWQWFESEHGNNEEAREIVSAWIDLCQRRQWKIFNEATQVWEPIQSYKAAFAGFMDEWYADQEDYGGTWTSQHR